LKPEHIPILCLANAILLNELQLHRGALIWINGNGCYTDKFKNKQGASDMEQNQDQKQFFIDLGKTAEEAVQRMQGFEENYYYFSQRSMQAVAWPLNFRLAEAAHRYANQDFGAALEFARDLQNAEDFQDAARLQTKYAETCLNLFWNQSKDVTQTYVRFPASAMTGPALYSLG
jgi:hypothetical protein